MAADTANGSARNKIIELERKLAQALVERDDLARDVEALCMETTANTTFSSSSVLRERIFSTGEPQSAPPDPLFRPNPTSHHLTHLDTSLLIPSCAEKELSKTRSEVVDVIAERESLREDLREVREAKRAGDTSYREQAERLQALEREVTFYRQQAAAAISQRDSTAWECEQLRQAAVEAEARARDAGGKAEAAEAERAVADRRAAEATARADDLSMAAAAAAAIPGLKSDLEKAREREKGLAARIEKLQAEVKEAKEAGAGAEAARAAAAAEAATAAESAAAQVEAAQSEAAAARKELGEVAQQKVEALMRLSEAEAARGRADAEVRRLAAELASARAQLGQAAQEKVAALMQVAELRAEADGGGSDAGSMRSGSARPTPKTSPAKATPESRWRWLGGGGSGRSASPVRSPVRSP